MPSIRNIIQRLEQLAPPSYQESYDNAQLLVGDAGLEAIGVLLTLDVTEKVVEEALEKGCNLIVAHHPIIFGGLKKLTGSNYVERTVIAAIKNDIAIYAIHTNLDNMLHGVNAKISERLGLTHTRILSPKKQLLRQLTVFVPHENKEALLKALSEAGAGSIGNYQHCSFQVEGTGTFMPTEAAQPHTGVKNEISKVEETRIEVIFPAYLEGKLLAAMRTAHPYEEVAYFLHSLENVYQEVGSGMIGELETPMDELAFLQFIKEKMAASCVKYTALKNKPIQKVAVCGGAGGFLLKAAIFAGADVFITSDYKYHEFFDADGKIVIADVGHYESEQFTKELLHELLSQYFPELPLEISATITNPVHYL